MNKKRKKAPPTRNYQITIAVTVEGLKEDSLFVTHCTNEHGEGEITMFPKNLSANFISCSLLKVEEDNA